ncbi:two-component system histidine kinase PnpS [Cytobacillus sp. FJAT-54145]|uniref:histidine kinase n=1 Tax=Cytobacillus spartinae TaxID=3299023 RepID=A0ABW6KKK5_9BACI
MTRFRTRLLFAIITLIFAVLIGLGLLLGQLFKSYYLNSFDTRLKKETSAISAYIEEHGGIKELDQTSVQKFSELLETRITVIDVEGKILLDSGYIESSSTKRHQQIIEQIYTKKINNQEEVIEVGGGHNLHYYWDEVSANGKNEGYVVLSIKLTEIQKVYRQIWWLLIFSLGIALVVIILLVTRITTRYTKPIEAATKVAIELTKGNYRARTYEDHVDETGMLSVSINVLARNLQEMMKAQEIQQDRLGTLIENMGSGLILIDSRGYINLVNRAYKEIFNVHSSDLLNKLYYEVMDQKVITDLVEEIFMTEKKIKRQMVIPISIQMRHFEVYGVPIIGTNDVWKGILLVFHDITELKRLEQMRKDFVANVSHELKTPVTSIKGFSETLLDGAMEDKTALKDFLTIILKESDRLQSLIQDLLDLSKIEQQGFALTVQRFNLVELLEEVIPILAGKAEQKQIELLVDSNLRELFVEGDIYRIKQIFINLVVNAILYTPNGGQVVISLEEQENKVITKVKDTGIGIEKEEIPRIFERFYRVDKARSRNSGGTGLGLAIVKHLVEAHKGHITVESTVGNGTTFIIELYKKFPKK